jgi:hypothetical protein
MLRPLAIIVTAIMVSRPEMARPEAEHLAKVLRQEAKQHDFDPLTAVAIVHFESGWNPRVVSDNGEDYGLGQIRARYIGACRKDADPLSSPSAECLEVKKSLLDAETNIRTMAQLISDSRKLCLEKTKSGAAPRWLASYQGLNFPSENKWCSPGEKTWRVLKYKSWLESELTKKPGSKPTPPPSFEPASVVKKAPPSKKKQKHTVRAAHSKAPPTGKTPIAKSR